VRRLKLITTLSLFSLVIYAQHDVILFTKNNRTITVFVSGSYIAFQGLNHEWFAGHIARIQNDSFYLKPQKIVYSFMRADTLYSDILPFALNDVKAMPKEGVQVDYINGDFRITTSAGHMHFYWVKNGWIFQVAGAGYILLNTINGLIQQNFSFAGAKYGIAAAVFLFGEILHLTYKITLPIGKKYAMQYVKVN
jgi:hypothetical protein